MPDAQTVTNSIIDDVAAGILYLVNLVLDRLQTMLTIVMGGINQLATTIANAILGIAVQIRLFLEGIAAQFFTFLQTALSNILTFLHGVWEQIYDLTVYVIGAIGNYVAELIAWVRSVGEAIVSAVMGWIAEQAAKIAAVIDAVVGAIVEVVSVAKDAIVGFITGIVARVEAIIQGVVNVINAAWAALVTGAEALIDEISKRLVDIREAFADLATDVVQSVTEIGEEYVKPIKDLISSFADAYIPERDEPTLAQMLAALQGTRTDPGQMEVFRHFWRDGFQDLAKRGPVYQMMFSFLFVLLTLIPSVIRIGGVLTEVTVQEWNRAYPWQVLQPGDAAQASRHGLISDVQAKEEMRRAGYDESRAEMILRLTAAVPAEGDLIAMKLRGVLDDPALEQALRQRGYDGQWTGRIRQMAELIPPVQDLILMAVREAFSPEVAARFGQYENYPEAVTVWAEKQGLSEEWARRYWAAHWSLPSPQQGFEMLHRGVIERGDLDLLLRALDVMPFWRDKLVQIAYSPYTRVDIRRMHQMRVITDEDVYRAHLDLGYDPDKAAKLTEFVLKLNRTAVTEDDVELGRLSRSAILGFYEDGVITRASALKLLMDIGHTLDAANLYLDSIDMQTQRTERREQADLIIEQARAGALTFDQAQDALRRLGLETLEVERAISRLLRALEAKVSLPTRADGEGFYVAGVITSTEYDDLLSRLGYAQKWRAAYLRQAETKKGARSKPS